LGGVEHVNSLVQLEGLEDKICGPDGLAERDYDWFEAGFDVLAAFPDQRLGRMRGYVNGNGFNLVIRFAVGGMVGDGKAVVANFALTKQDIEFCADKVLKHCSDVIGASASGLKFAGLVEEVADVGTK
jgi:hypothetical protein